MKNPSWLCVLAVHVMATTTAGAETDVNWAVYGGDAAQRRYSGLDQINTENVAELQVAWRYDTGDADAQGSQIQCNPLVIGGVLYGTSPKLKVFALDAASGQEIWRFDPFAGRESGQGINRGLVYWEAGQDQRILFTAGPQLFALDADTGLPIATFGEHGKVDLRVGLGRPVEQLQVDATSPGVLYQDLLIQGSRVGETPQAAPGHVRAFDVRTGELAWVFHTIPQPGEFGHESWPPDAWRQAGGVNSWSGMSVDVKRGMVFVPTGSPAYDFYGGNRAGDNLFANSVIALDARNGRRLWHFQTVHHDLWDRDLPAPPNLVALQRDGATIDAVAQVTKSGFVFVLDRETGAPLFPVEERPVPASDVAGEASASTQPVPLMPPPFTRQRFTVTDVTDISAQARAFVLEKLNDVHTGEAFLPPRVGQSTLIFPGFDGGAEWGGAAFDPESGLLFVNATELPWTYQLVQVPNASGDPAARAYQQQCAGCHGLDRRGNGKEFPSLIGVGQRLSYPRIAGIIRDGKGRMPGFPQLPFEDILLLLDYLNSAETAATPAPAASASVPDPTGFLHTGYFPLYDQEGFPGIKPPWGTLTAIDLNQGEIRWQVPLGEYPELAARGIRNTGTETYGGPVVTRGGLIFIAATMDEKIRAFDKATGRVLWEAELPAGGFATPATYAVNVRQFVVIAAGGGKSGRRSSGQYIAFALPAGRGRP